jgi:molecular chaperone DnaK (HSP70)
MKFLVLCLFFVGFAYANVMGIDFGSEFVKVTSPHGNASIDIVLNEQTRRKSNNFVGFRGDDRFFGDEAKNLAPRFPDNMFSMINKLIGFPFDSPETQQFRELLTTFALKEGSQRKGVNVVCRQDPDCDYSSELLVAMYFQYLKLITSKDAKIKPQEAVFAVPADWTMNQRQSLVDAAGLTDLKVLSLLHSTTATALQYGMQKRGFGNDTVNVVIYDMGSTKTEVGVYRFSPPEEPKDGKKVKLAVSLGQIETLHIEVDSTLGGRTFDACIARFLEDEIVKTMNIPRIIGGTSLQQHKAMFSLIRAANGIKETLSANQAAPVTVEGVAPDRDFSGKVTREQFETECSSLFERAVQIAKRAVDKSGLDLADVNAFELMGGGVRPPKIVSDLSAFLGRPVDRTLNGDEAAAFGAGYYGARLSGYFRVRSFSIRDYLPQSVHFRIVGADGTLSAIRPLFVKSAFGARKSITVNRTDDFTIALLSTVDGESFAPLMTVNVSGVKSALEGLNYFNPTIVHNNNTHIVRIELKLSENGVIVVEDSEVRVRLAANVTKKLKLRKNVSDETQDHTPDQEKVVDDVNGTAQTIDVEPPKPAFEIQMKKRSTSLKPTTEFAQPSMGSEEILEAKSILSGLEKRDKIKRDTATAKNNLETFIQWIRLDGIFENEEASALMSPEEKQIIEETTDQVKEWYEDGEGSYDSCTKAEFDEKLALLKNATATVREKLQEKENDRKPKAPPKKASKKREPKPDTRQNDVQEEQKEATTPEVPQEEL